MQVRYSQDHEYVIVEDGVGTVGITNHAQERLSEVIFIELPRVGAQVQKGGVVGVVESVKAASDLYSPVSGKILGVNEALTGKPELVNEDAGPAESGQICSVGRRKIAKKIAKNKRCYANTLRPRSRMLLKVMKGG